MCIRSFLRDRRGNVAIMFAVLFIPIIGFIGAGVDYSRAARAKDHLQYAADATALAVARAPRTLDEDALYRIAEEYLAANMAGMDFTYDLRTATRDRNNVIVEADANLPTTIFSLLGVDDVPISVHSETMWSIGKLEIALVLDNTGSMGSYNRMPELKAATRALVDAMEEAAYEPGLVKISIVPFDRHVKIGTQHRSATWIRHTFITQFLWNGCVEDRDQNHDTTDAPVSGQSTKYPATLCGSSSLAEVHPLTEDFDDLRDTIDSMVPAGNTNITIGLAWGLATLSSHAPYSEGVPYGTEDVTKIMVMMTDGDNTQNRFTSSRNSIDARTRLACTAVKDAGVQLFTVRLMEGNASLLRDCASTSKMYYDVAQASDLGPAFEAIGEHISKLRIAR